MKAKKIRYVQELLIIVYRKKEPVVIYYESNLKKHNKYKMKEILSLCFWGSRLLENIIFWLGDDTNSSIISHVLLQIENRTWSFQRETNSV